MSWGAYVFGDLRWPMPDLGLLAVWRAMPIDPSKWGDWDGFVDGVDTDTIARLFDQLGDGGGQPAPFTLELDEHGAKLRAYLDEAHAGCWQALAVAWRAAADLGATGEFVWAPGRSCPLDIAYQGVIADYDSRWQTCPAEIAAELAGRKEIEALLPPEAPAIAPTAIEATAIEATAIEATAIEAAAAPAGRPKGKKRASTKKPRNRKKR